ncbi:MAG: HlyD family efflux transporter periplasmic adaptor subunit [Verrucomicrobia bacterium]|nr:HlyD family efflux transporter periplasmic adaptor subunit [Verrucomicrobiota bacterium]
MSRLLFCLAALAGAQFLQTLPGGASAALPTPVARGRIDVEGGIVLLAAQRDGIVREVLVEEGDLVEAGQPLARQDDSSPRLALEIAEAEAAQLLVAQRPAALRAAVARREQVRLERLQAGGATTELQAQQGRDQAELAAAEAASLAAQHRVAVARVAAARYEVEQRTIRAPFGGRVVRRLVKPGEGASTLNVTPLFWLIPEPGRIVRAELEERFVGRVAPGQSAEIVFETDEARRLRARVLRVGAIYGPRRPHPDDPSERTDARVVECVLSVEEPALLVGQRVLVRFLAAGSDGGPR